MSGGAITVRWGHFLLAASLANFGVGVVFAVMYALLPFESIGSLYYFERSDWMLRLLASMLSIGILAIPVPTIVSALAVKAFSGSQLSWRFTVSIGPMVSSLLIPLYVWSQPSNWIMVAVSASLGIVLNVVAIERFDGVVHQSPP